MTTYFSHKPTQTTHPEMIELIDVINKDFEKSGTTQRIYVVEQTIDNSTWFKKSFERKFFTYVSLPLSSGEESNEYQCINIGTERKVVLAYLYGYFLHRGNKNEKNV